MPTTTKKASRPMASTMSGRIAGAIANASSDVDRV